MAEERPAEIRRLFNIPVTILSRKILLPKIINKNPRINVKEKKRQKETNLIHGQTHCNWLNCYSEKREWRLTYEKTTIPVLN
jgi:hypothetical protein